MQKLVIVLLLGLNIMYSQDAAGQYKLTGVDVQYTYITRDTVSLTVTDAYGLGVTQEVAEIPNSVPFTTQEMQLTDAALSAVGINLNINLNSDGSGVIAEGSFYPDVNTITDENGNCVTVQQTLPVSDNFTYVSNGSMMANAGMLHPGVNVLGLPGISTRAGTAMGGFGLSGSLTFEDFGVTPSHPTLCGSDASDCYNFTVGDIDSSGTIEVYPNTNALGIPEYVPAGESLTGVSGGYFLKKGLNADSLHSVYSGNTVPDFILEWHGVDGASSGLGYGDDENVDEDGDGSWFDRQIGIPGIIATYMNPACGYNQPIFGDVSATFEALGLGNCVDQVGLAPSGYLMDPSGSLATWGNTVTAHGALYVMCSEYVAGDALPAGTCETIGEGILLVDDSDHDMDPACLADFTPGNIEALLDCSGRLTMNFDVPCVPVIEAREVVAEFINVVGTPGCMDATACNYNAAATVDDNSCYNGQMLDENSNLAPCYTSIGQACTHDCNGQFLSIEDMTSLEEFSLSSVYPNPFNPITNISYSVPQNTNIEISIYDISGRQIETLFNGFKMIGEYSINWNASKYPSGVYFVSLQAEGYSKTQKVVLMK